MDPPLIVHVIYRLDIGGLENGLVNLINHMPAGRYRHAIVCLAGYSSFRQRIRRDDVEVFSLDKQPGKDPAAYLRMWRLLRRLRPALVHTRNLGTVDMQWIALLAGVRSRVHGEHGWEASDPRGLNPRNLFIRRACRPVIRRYVAVSRDISRWLQAQVRVDAARIRQVYNGVSLDRFQPGGAPPPDVPWQAGMLVLGTVGRLDPVKNQLQLLRAFHRLCASGEEWAPKLRLVIAGDGPLRDALRQEVARLDLAARVWFAGARDDVPALMRCMDIFVLPSLNEGISNTILEAMAMGLPVVATAVGGNPELVVDGITGALCKGTDAQSLDAPLRRLASDPEARRAAGQAGRLRIEREFGLPSMVNGYLSIYDELLCAA